MQGKYIIENLHGEKRKESRDPVFAHIFDVKADKNQIGVTLK